MKVKKGCEMSKHNILLPNSFASIIDKEKKEKDFSQTHKMFY